MTSGMTSVHVCSRSHVQITSQPKCGKRSGGLEILFGNIREHNLEISQGNDKVSTL